jgi:putative methanogenesis marker protein 8
MDERDEHVIEAMGKSKILIKNGKVVEVSNPEIDYCPLFEKYRGIKKLDTKSITENIEFRIQDFGMCTPNRILRMKDFLSFGVSEILSTIIEEGLIDCVVAVCEGCGTVILIEPELIQGVGGRVSGLVSTSPIKEIIESLGRENILDSKLCKIDQMEGVRKAIEMGYKNIAVTIVSAEDAQKLGELEKELKDVNIYLFVVHTTGLTEDEAEILFDHADIITGCASKTIRKTGEARQIFSVGASIPIFGVTESGKKFIDIRVKKIGGLKDKNDAKLPEPLI